MITPTRITTILLVFLVDHHWSLTGVDGVRTRVNITDLTRPEWTGVNHSRVNIEFYLIAYQLPLGNVTLITNHTESPEQYNLTNNDDDDCSNKALDRIVITCDYTKASFKIQIDDVNSEFYVEVLAPSQNMEKSVYREYIGYVKPDNISVTGNTMTKGEPDPVKIGDHVVRVCGFDGGWNNRAAFTWVRDTDKQMNNNKTIQTSKNQPNSTLRFVARHGDEGYYQCEAEYNPVNGGRFKSGAFYLNVIYAPWYISQSDDQEIQDGDHAVLFWTVMANPQVGQPVWTKHGVGVVTQGAVYKMSENTNGSTYTFKLEMTGGDDTYGVYSCTVENEYGKTSVQRSFIVKKIEPETTTVAITTVEPTTPVRPVTTPGRPVTTPVAGVSTPAPEPSGVPLLSLINTVVVVVVLLMVVVVLIMACIILHRRAHTDPAHKYQPQPTPTSTGYNNATYQNRNDITRHESDIELQLGQIKTPNHLPPMPEKPDDWD